MKTKLLSLRVVGAALGLVSVRAEKIPMTTEEMKVMATHIITGTVQGIYQRIATADGWKRTHYVAEIRIKDTEKGDGLKRDELVYVRYWQKQWVGKGFQPPDTAGHRNIPVEGETLRFYVVRNAYSGFGTSNDGGYDVLGADGFQKLPAKAAK